MADIIAANIIASGDWWRLESDGTLYIYCVGDMPDYSYSYSRYAPWYSIRASVTSLRVADSVTSIGDWAFYLCGNLSDAIISASVTSIGYGAFRFCKGLTSVTIPNGVISIGNSAFYYCESLTSVTIPSSVTSIGYGAFEFCYGLTAFIVDSGNQTYSSEDGVLFNKNRSNLLCCPQGKTGAYEIPNGVTSIEGSAFAYCESLTSVTMPDGMTSIGNDAFWQCKSLISVTIPSSVTSIGYDAFGDCEQLISVTIPDGLTFIESGTFTSCESLTSVTIPYSVTYIGEAAFNACESLTDVYYAGTEAQWDGIYVDEANDGLQGATIHYNYTPPTPTPPPEPPLTEGLYIGGTLSGGGASPGGETPSSGGASSGGETPSGGGASSGGETPSGGGASSGEETPSGGSASPEGEIDGAGVAFSLEQCPEISYAQSVSLDGNELRSDELYITVRVRQNPDAFPASLSGVNRSTPVWYDRTDKDGNRRLEKYYWKSMERVSRYDYAITAQSPIGRLTADFPGGLYNGETLPGILSAVMGGVAPFTADSRLDAVRVYGWAPYQSRRETLHMLALAYGFIIRRDANGDLFFTLPDSAPAELPDSVIYVGGSVDYRTGKTYARIDVTECAFLRTANDREITLFDNTDGSPAANRQTVKFQDAPVYGVTASEGLTLHSYGVNHAVVSGIGTLSGKAYAKTTSVFSLAGDPAADPDAVLSIDNIPLITSLNSETVAAKYREIANAPVVEMDFIRRTENAGDCVSFVDPYGTARTGYLTELSGRVTSIDRVSARFVTGYAHHWGNAYNAVLVLTGSGVWTVPASLDGATIRVALIGGGQGGASGQHGADDTASGCLHGAPGAGGRARVVTIAVSEGDTFQYQSGAGGAGGQASGDYDTDERGNSVYRNNSGALGTASVFALIEDGDVAAQYSSDDGACLPMGYRDIIHGVQYAVSGPDDGVDGGAATTATESGSRESPAWTDAQRPLVTLPWDNSQSWTSGAVGAGKYRRQEGDYAYEEWAYGGLGGGAAVGADGADGGDAGEHIALDSADWGGDGGDGADASAIFPTDTRSYGSGGSGGHGGGEGGAGGAGHTTESGGGAPQDGRRGAGGSGSAGQAGKDGCILIYYHDYFNPHNN